MPLTLQQIFDKGLAHIRQQGGPCMRRNPDYFGDESQQEFMCAYRNDKGQACIVGGLFPDSAYVPGFDSMEGGSLYYLFLGMYDVDMRTALFAGGIGIDAPGVKELLHLMQEAHDKNSHYKGDKFMLGFEESMKVIAMEKRLIYTPPEPPDGEFTRPHYRR